MSQCPVFSADGPASIADALRSVDCLSGQAVHIAFSRLFGDDGALGQALTLVLTLYVALLAISLLTGRSHLRLNMLTPRMLQLGLVLTFATSWVAYQSVGWNLVAGAPDQIAGVILGTKGSATQAFARRLDTLFEVIAQSATAAQTAPSSAPAPGTALAPQVAGNAPKPADLLWAASLLLLLGTVGVLIVARIALAAVMALGPVFIILALFGGTRGLFEGWLKAVVMLAITPMLAVLLGGGTLVLIAPMIAGLARAGKTVSLDLATAVFLAAFVYAALMVLAMRAAAAITGGWRLGQAPAEAGASEQRSSVAPAAALPMPMPAPVAATLANGDPLRGMPSGVHRATVHGAAGEAGPASAGDRRTNIVHTAPVAISVATDSIARDPRLRPLGQGFRAPRRGAT
jgi:type IV secretion system protein VirB6